MFVTTVLEENVKIASEHVGRNVGDVLELRAREKIEGKCGPHGFVKPGTTTILGHDGGEVVDIDFGRFYLFRLRLRAEVCNPLPGMRAKAVVQAVNQIGILAESGYFDSDGMMTTVVETVIIRDPVLVNNEVDVEALVEGDEIFVEVLGRVYELNDSKIRAFGRTVASVEDGPPGAPAASGPPDSDTSGGAGGSVRLASRIADAEESDTEVPDDDDDDDQFDPESDAESDMAPTDPYVEDDVEDIDDVSEEIVDDESVPDAE